MGGIREMINVRGGLRALNEPLQMKICRYVPIKDCQSGNARAKLTFCHRADVEGAADCIQAPHVPLGSFRASISHDLHGIVPGTTTRCNFPSFDSVSSPRSCSGSVSASSSLASTTTSPIASPTAVTFRIKSPLLRSLINHLSRTSQTISTVLSDINFGSFPKFSRQASVLDPFAFDEYFVSLQHDLLRLCAPDPDSTWEPSTRPSCLSDSDEALCLGALVYIKTLTRSSPPLHSRPLARRLLARLRHQVLMQPDPRGDGQGESGERRLPQSAILWLTLVGAAQSYNEERREFVRLLQLNGDGNVVIATNDNAKALSSWNKFKEQLQYSLWIPAVHEATFRGVWEESRRWLPVER